MGLVRRPWHRPWYLCGAPPGRMRRPRASAPSSPRRPGLRKSHLGIPGRGARIASFVPAMAPRGGGKAPPTRPAMTTMRRAATTRSRRARRGRRRPRSRGSWILARGSVRSRARSAALASKWLPLASNFTCRDVAAPWNEDSAKTFSR